MNIKTFIDSNNRDLNIKTRKHAIIFENESDKNEYRVSFIFKEEQMKEVIDYIINECNYAWSNFTPKEATTFGADYSEYYDRKLDNNGYLTILDEGLWFEKPVDENSKLYQLNKAKAQSLAYDLLTYY